MAHSRLKGIKVSVSGLALCTGQRKARGTWAVVGGHTLNGCLTAAEGQWTQGVPPGAAARLSPPRATREGSPRCPAQCCFLHPGSPSHSYPSLDQQRQLQEESQREWGNGGTREMRQARGKRESGEQEEQRGDTVSSGHRTLDIRQLLGERAAACGVLRDERQSGSPARFDAWCLTCRQAQRRPRESPGLPHAGGKGASEGS